MHDDESTPEAMMRRRRETWDAEVARYRQAYRPTPETSARRVVELPRDDVFLEDAFLEDTVPLPRYRPERLC